MAQQRVRKKSPAQAPKKRAPKQDKYARKSNKPGKEGDLAGPLKASDEVIQKARERKSDPAEPVPDNFFLKEEEDKARFIQTYKDRIKNPTTAIRAHCVECMGGYTKEVDACPSKQCALYPFRLGKNPFHKRVSDVKPIPPHIRKKMKEKQK